ncbi:hypothetical protein CVT24_009053 [Panaeolus cyanescens]|uniref:Uncharacterized protein n=1 Tax=Panaeolus cyanescens TaxID=181874 RepID=A0A409WEP0_9AGAR|nr:hypothetical protein CVT24_009053 [Panaeolus cyanescens]
MTTTRLLYRIFRSSPIQYLLASTTFGRGGSTDPRSPTPGLQLSKQVACTSDEEAPAARPCPPSKNEVRLPPHRRRSRTHPTGKNSAHHRQKARKAERALLVNHRKKVAKRRQDFAAFDVMFRKAATRVRGVVKTITATLTTLEVDLHNVAGFCAAYFALNMKSPIFGGFLAETGETYQQAHYCAQRLSNILGNVIRLVNEECLLTVRHQTHLSLLETTIRQHHSRRNTRQFYRSLKMLRDDTDKYDTEYQVHHALRRIAEQPLAQARVTLQKKLLFVASSMGFGAPNQMMWPENMGAPIMLFPAQFKLPPNSHDARPLLPRRPPAEQARYLPINEMSTTLMDRDLWQSILFGNPF